jgi:hypothetical protein
VISQKGKETLIKEDIGRRKGRSLGKKEGFPRIKIIKGSWTRVLFDDDDDVVFHGGLDQFLMMMMMMMVFGRRRKREKSEDQP